MGQAKYLQVADQLAEEIESGQLVPGARIATHRALAARFGVTISTVTRAVAEAEQRGLLVARPGSGTFVLSPDRPPAATRPAEPIDLRHNGTPATQAGQDGLDAALLEIAKGGAAGLFTAHSARGLAAHRAAASGWLRLRGLAAHEGDVLFSHGAQHGLSACLTAFAPPGSTVLSEPWIYAGFRRLAAAAGVRLWGVALDEHGMQPDALDSALEATGATLVLLSPAMQNPTTITVPPQRRRDILAVCRKHDAYILEDDVFGHLAGDSHAPLAELDPDRAAYVTGLSKSVAPGLRLGLVRAPRAMRPLVEEALGIQHWVGPAFMGEVFARMVASGAAEAILASQRAEMRARFDLARAALGRDIPGMAHQPSYHLWLAVPARWRLDDFVACLEERHVRVLPSGHFAVDDEQVAPRIRVCLGNTDKELLAAAMTTIGQVLREPSRMQNIFV